MNGSGPVKKAVDKVEEAVEAATDGSGPEVPGVPGPEAVRVAEPTEPRQPLPPKPDQAAPVPVSATGRGTAARPEVRSQRGEFLTTAQGARLRDSDHSLKAGPRGPVLLQDHHLREKITHFDHERIPERSEERRVGKEC